ncbi:MAG TPA: DUF5916 domain-containing protein, partial [Terriglobales bacterium]
MRGTGLIARAWLASVLLACTVVTLCEAQDTQRPPQASSTGAPEAHTAPAHPQVKGVQIPHISKAPTLAEFEDMQPQGAAKELAAVNDFVQTDPSNGSAPSQKTTVYLGYDDKALYVVWVCFDSEPNKVRAHMARRENIYQDDYVEMTLDTFHDQRHALTFGANPFGVQADGLWTEGSNNNPDDSWDTVWDSAGKLTRNGYIVWERIPFRSLRFHGVGGNPWGVTLYRYVSRVNESDYWPHSFSNSISGRLNQAGVATGIKGVESGHNFQLNPYAEMRSFHALDTRDPINPTYSNKLAAGKVGLDSKVVFHDSLVLDTTINPDFAQVESDEPQNTVNQRFEVFFPEKRPFFLENANFFNVPGSSPIGGNQTQLVFTRRIADPEFGARLTGKTGPWNLGFLVADDRSPGEVLPGDPNFQDRAKFVIGSVSHDVGQNSSIGAIFTDREFAGQFNRVGGLDGTFKLNPHWNTSFHSVVSSTRDLDGYTFGQDHEIELDGQGLRYFNVLSYQDITPDFK